MAPIYAYMAPFDITRNLRFSHFVTGCTGVSVCHVFTHESSRSASAIFMDSKVFLFLHFFVSFLTTAGRGITCPRGVKNVAHFHHLVPHVYKLAYQPCCRAVAGSLVQAAVSALGVVASTGICRQHQRDGSNFHSSFCCCCCCCLLLSPSPSSSFSLTRLSVWWQRQN